MGQSFKTQRIGCHSIDRKQSHQPAQLPQKPQMGKRTGTKHSGSGDTPVSLSQCGITHGIRMRLRPEHPGNLKPTCLNTWLIQLDPHHHACNALCVTPVKLCGTKRCQTIFHSGVGVGAVLDQQPGDFCSPKKSSSMKRCAGISAAQVHRGALIQQMSNRIKTAVRCGNDQRRAP